MCVTRFVCCSKIPPVRFALTPAVVTCGIEYARNRVLPHSRLSPIVRILGTKRTRNLVDDSRVALLVTFPVNLLYDF